MSSRCKYYKAMHELDVILGLDEMVGRCCQPESVEAYGRTKKGFIEVMSGSRCAEFHEGLAKSPPCNPDWIT